MSKIAHLIFLILIGLSFSGCISFSLDIGGSGNKAPAQPAYYPPAQPAPYYYY